MSCGPFALLDGRLASQKKRKMEIKIFCCNVFANILINNVQPTHLSLSGRLMADLIIGFLQDAFTSVVHTYKLSQGFLPHAELLDEALGSPIYEGNSGDSTKMCMREDGFRDLQIGNKVIWPAADLNASHVFHVGAKLSGFRSVCD